MGDRVGKPGKLIAGNRGWRPNVLKFGDKITATTLPAVDGRPSALDAVIEFEDGRKISDGLPQ
jgi:hypothetical protein